MAVPSLPGIKRYQEVPEYVSGLQAPSRLEVLEERLNQQERNTQALIERAFKIKEDVLDSLNYSRGSWQDEKHSREMLAEHIRNITAVVNRLNNDIGLLEEQIRSRDNTNSTTNSAVKNIEVNQVASVTDLRGRVVRCDTAISKLSSDVRGCHDAVKHAEYRQQDVQTKLNERIRNIETQIFQMLNSLDRAASDNKVQLQHVEGGTSQQITLLDSRTKSLVEDLRNAMTTYHITSESEQEKLEVRILGHIEKALHPRDLRLERLEKRLDDLQIIFENKIHKLEDNFTKETLKWEAFQKNNWQTPQHYNEWSLESKVFGRLESDLRKQTEEMHRLKHEYREGFSTVHESITSMRTVVDGKRKLLEEQLRKEISLIRKMVVLV